MRVFVEQAQQMPKEYASLSIALLRALLLLLLLLQHTNGSVLLSGWKVGGVAFDVFVCHWECLCGVCSLQGLFTVC